MGNHILLQVVTAYHELLKGDKENRCKNQWEERERAPQAASATALLELRALVLASCLVVPIRQLYLLRAALIFLFIHQLDADDDDAADDDDLMPQIAQDCPRPLTHLGLRMHCQRWMMAS